MLMQRLRKSEGLKLASFDGEPSLCKVQEFCLQVIKFPPKKA